MNTETVNNIDNIVQSNEIPEVPPDTAMINAPSIIPNIDELTANIALNIERRALAKKLGKKGRDQFGTISETAKKLNYIDLIQKLREINKENENEDTTQDS